MPRLLPSLLILLLPTTFPAARLLAQPPPPPLQIHCPESLELQWMVGVPHVLEPTALAWDERGQMYVSERSGVVKRLIPSPATNVDADKDGMADKVAARTADGVGWRADVWCDELPDCHGLLPSRGGLIVFCSQEILFVADRDLDGHADQREILLQGLNPIWSKHPRLPPFWSLDGWIHVVGRFAESTAQGPKLLAPVPLGVHGFRFRPDGSAVERLPASALVRPTPDLDDWQPLLEPAVNRGFPPSLHADALLSTLQGSWVECVPEQQRVLWRRPYRDGLQIRWRSPVATKPSQADETAVWSDDPSFRPTATFPAPDGSLWLIDTGPEKGEAAGRLWRLTPRSWTPPPLEPLRMHALTDEQLAAEIASPRWWRRETARRLIMERVARGAVTVLPATIRGAPDPLVVINALSALDLVDSLNSEVLEECLRDTDPLVRQQAVRLSQPVLDKRQGLFDQVLLMTSDADMRVRYQVAVALGESRSNRVAVALARLARADGHDPLMRQAIVRAADTSRFEVLKFLEAQPETIGQAGWVRDRLRESPRSE